jgi:hypothetical protein
MLLHLPSMAWDDYFAQLRHNRDEELQRFKDFVVSAQRGWRDDTTKLFFKLLRFLGAPPARPDAVVRLVVWTDYGKRRNWVEIDVTPRRRRKVPNTLSPRVVWDWVFGVLLDAGADSEIDSLLTNFTYQIAYYNAFGLASDFFPKNVGRAPFSAAMSGNRDRLKSQIAAHAGITVKQLETLPQLDRDQVISAHSKATMQQFASRVLSYLQQPEPDIRT